MRGSQRINRRGRRDDVDAILLIRGTFEIQGFRAAEWTGIHVKDREPERVAAIQLDIALKNASSRTVHVGHSGKLALRRVRDGKRDVGVALRRARGSLAVGISEPASGTGALDLPTAQRAGFEVVNHDRLLLLSPRRRELDRRGREDQQPAKPYTYAARQHSGEQAAREDV